METLNKTKLLERVEEALDSMRGFLIADGGNVELLDVDENMNVHIRLLGNCVGCSMSHMTMKLGIEDAIKKAVPQVKGVIATDA